MSGLAEKLADPTRDVGVKSSTDHAEANNLRMVFCLAIAGVVTPAQAPDATRVRRQAHAGYSQIGDIKSTHEGKVVNAMQDGKDVHLVVDSSGQSKSVTSPS